MSEGEPGSSPPVEALPDIIASPDDARLADDGSHTEATASVSADDPPTASSLENQAIKDGAVNDEQPSVLGMETRLEPPTPEMTAVSLPIVAETEEQWTSCHMTWRGKLYDFRVGANDL